MDHSDTSLFAIRLPSTEGASMMAAEAGVSLNEFSGWESTAVEGQLAVDVIETNREILVVSTMAGAVAPDIQIFIHNDLLTIRGLRRSPAEAVGDATYLHQECFWGPFSRTVVLPASVKGDLAKADYRQGVLMIRVPKRDTSVPIPVAIVED